MFKDKEHYPLISMNASLVYQYSITLIIISTSLLLSLVRKHLFSYRKLMSWALWNLMLTVNYVRMSRMDKLYLKNIMWCLLATISRYCIPGFKYFIYRLCDNFLELINTMDYKLSKESLESVPRLQWYQLRRSCLNSGSQQVFKQKLIS